jgi:hypothetical protein
VAVWSYPLALNGQDIRAACARGGIVQKLLDAASNKSPE